MTAAMTPLLPPSSKAAWGHLLKAAIDVSMRVSGIDDTTKVLTSLSTAPTLEEYPALEQQAPSQLERSRSYTVSVGGRWADICDEDSDER